MSPFLSITDRLFRRVKMTWKTSTTWKTTASKNELKNDLDLNLISAHPALWFLTLTVTPASCSVCQPWPGACLFTVGARDFPPLSTDALPAGRDSDGSERWQQHSGETGQEQTASPDLWEWREAGPWAQGRQICGVFSSHAGTHVWFHVFVVGNRLGYAWSNHQPAGYG